MGLQKLFLSHLYIGMYSFKFNSLTYNEEYYEKNTCANTLHYKYDGIIKRFTKGLFITLIFGCIL